MYKLFCGIIETLQNKTHVVGRTIQDDIYQVRTLANISIQLVNTKTKRNTSRTRLTMFILVKIMVNNTLREIAFIL